MTEPRIIANPDDWHAARCGHNFPILKCPYEGCVPQELYEVLADFVKTYDEPNGTINVAAFIPAMRAALAKAREP